MNSLHIAPIKVSADAVPHGTQWNTASAGTPTKLPDSYHTMTAQRKADVPLLKRLEPTTSSTPLWEKRIHIAPDQPGRIHGGTAAQGYALPPTYSIQPEHRQTLVNTLNLLETYKTPKETLASLNKAPQGRKVFVALAEGIHDQFGTGAINAPFKKGDSNADFLVLVDPKLLKMPTETRLAALYEQLLFADIDLNRRPFNIEEQIRKNQKMDGFHREIGAPTHFEEQYARELRSELIASGEWNQARDRFSEVWSPRVQTSLLELRVDGKVVALADEFAWLENLSQDLSNPNMAAAYQTRSQKLRDAIHDAVNRGLADPHKLADALEAESFIAGADWKTFLEQLKGNQTQPLTGEELKRQRRLYLSPGKQQML